MGEGGGGRWPIIIGINKAFLIDCFGAIEWEVDYPLAVNYFWNQLLCSGLLSPFDS